MFRRKQDVDRHVASILGRIKEEREKQAKGYQIARLYFEVGESEIARRYLASFLSVRETVPQAYRLLGQIEEALGNKDNAVDSYKRFLEMGGSNKDVVLKICELYADIGVDPETGKYWLERAEKLHPQNDNIFKLKEKLIKATPGKSTDEDLEKLIAAELVKKPQDVELRIKLLQTFLEVGRVDEAYANALETDRTTAFTTSLEWYECLLAVFRAYESKADTREDTVFMFHYLVVLYHLTYLRLTNKDVVESAEALHRFDLTVQAAMNINNPSEQWDAFLTEMQGQLFFLAGTLLLKRAQKGSLTWNSMRPVAAVFYLLCQTVPTVDAQATWFVQPPQDREKMYAWLYKNSFFRISQSGHMLYHLCQGEPTTWGHHVQQQCCSPAGQERAYEALFPIKDMRCRSQESYLMNTHKFCNTSLAMPSHRQLYDVDRVAHTFHPDKLSEMVWLCLQRYSFGDAHQPDYNFKTYETLQYSVRNMDNGTAETVCQLDTEAFLYASVRCAALTLKEQQLSMDGDVSRPPMLPLCLCKKLCTPEQEQWWQTAHSFYSNSIKDNFSKMRHTLQRGIEVVRLVGNHGLSAAMVVHLAKTFDAKVKSLTEGDHGNRGSANQLACLEARAAFYWRHALTVLSRLEKNQRGPYMKTRLFDDGDDGDLLPEALQEMIQDAKFASATIAMREGRYEDAVKGFERLTTPYASFYRAQIYKSMAQRELEGSGLEEVKQQRYTALMAQAREALYLTMDHLGGNKNHELNILLTRELDDVESKLNCFDWVNGAEDENTNRDDMDETDIKTPVKQHNGHLSNLNHPHSTPKSAGHPRSVRQRLLMSELTSDSPIQSQHAPAPSPPSHTRPSPERLDAQIKSINYSQSQLFKMVLDRNEELVVMYRGLVQQLQDSSVQLKVALGENQTLMQELRGMLLTNKDSMATMRAELAETKETVRQLREEYQANAAAAAMASNTSLLNAQSLAASQITAGYLMGPHYQPSQYPPYAQAPPPLATAPGPGYRYPLLPGYPPRPATPVAPAAASARLSGTAPSNFGKFRGADHQSAAEGIMTEDEEDEEENGHSLYGSEYGETTPQYCVQPVGPSLVTDWLPGHNDGQRMDTILAEGVTYQPVNQPTQPAIPQPGYFASALKGQPLQYATASMPGPGFFSTPPAATVVATINAAAAAATTQSAIVTALGGKPGVILQAPAPQSIPVIGVAGGAKPAQSAFPAGKVAEAALFHDYAKLTTAGGDIPSVDVRVIQDTASKQGSIVIRKKDSQEVLCSHNIANIRVASSFNPNYFLWSLSGTGDRKLDETIRLSFASADQCKKMQAAVEQVIKEAGIKPTVPPAALSPFGGRSPSAQPSPQTTAVVSTPATIIKPAASQGTTPTAASLAPISSTASQAAAGGSKPTLGGFTFSTSPIVKSAEPSQDERDKAKAGSQFKLKESTIKTTNVSAVPTTTTTTTTASEASKPFAGFSFTPTKPAGSAFGSAVSSVATTSAASSAVPGASTAGPTFVFGQGASGGAASFASLSAQSATADAFKPSDGSKGFQASPQPMFSKVASPAKSPGGKDDEDVEEYEPNVDFKPIIDLPDLVEVKTGEEDWIKVFNDRVKLFRFDSDTSEWKERGIGELKILRARGGTPQFRILMRREQVLKVCANHYITPQMKLTPLSASDRAWCYHANDFAEEEMKVEKFAVRFKNSDKAGEFKATFEKCQKEAAEADKTASPAAAAKASAPEKPQQKSEGAKPSLAEMFKKAEGSWECPGCLISNKAETVRCPACQTLKPGADAEEAGPAAKDNPFAPAASGGFGGFTLASSSEKSVFGGSAAPGGGFKFGSTASDDQKDESKTTAAPAGGFKFGAQAAASDTGFKFGSPQKTATDTATTTTATTTTSATGFKFTFGTPSAASPAPKPGFTFGSTSEPQSTPGFTFGSSTTTAKDSAAGDPSFSFSKPQAAPAAEKKSETGSALLQQLLTSEDPPELIPKPVDTGSVFGSGSTSIFGGTPDSSKGFQARLGQVSSPTKEVGKDGKEKTGFQFTFNLQKQQQQQHSQQPTSPKSPETDEQGFYLNKEGEDSHIYFEPVVPLPEKIDVKTGEEEEDILFESRAKLYRFSEGEWRERGLGTLKILQHKVTGRIRLLMRREQVLKICCNHYISSDLDLKPLPRSEGKAWIWYAMDFTDGVGQMEQLAVRFRDVDTANKFKTVFDRSKEKMTPSKTEGAVSDGGQAGGAGVSPASVSRRLFQQEEDSDVEFLYEETPTEDQKQRARKLLLPDTFYLYENRPDCPGCIGCEDYDPSKSPVVAAPIGRQTAAMTTASAQPPKQPIVEQTVEKESQGLFGGGSGISFSSLAAASSDTPAFGPKDSSKPFQWAGAGQRLFGAAGGAGDEEAEEGEVTPSDDVHFDPIIPLPDLVEVKTGEEEWTALFCQRAKLYRFDVSQWKERGIGEMKIIKHKTQLLFRVLLRREQVLKVACNHLISTTMELKPMSTSETAWCWVAHDYTNNEPQMEQFALKLKTVELAKEFKRIFEDCQEKLRQGDAAAVQETMVSSSQTPTGDRGNIQHTQALNVGAQDTISSTTQPITGDRGNPYYSQQLDTAAKDTVTPSAQPVTGDKGNPFYSQQLNAAAQDSMVSSSQPVVGDKGNPYFSQALDVAAQDAQITSTTVQPLIGGGNPLFSQLLGSDEAGAEEQYDDEDYDDDDEDDDDDESTEEDDDRVEFEKRVMLMCYENSQWKRMGMGDMRVLYDDDLSANKLLMTTDEGEKVCNHVITMELTVALDEKTKSCEWQPIDFATDEPIRRHFRAVFSSSVAAQEFVDIFRQGQKLAAESEISAKFPEEIEVPEVFSTGDRSEAGAAKK